MYVFAAAIPFVQKSGATSTGSLIDGIDTLSVDPAKVTAGGVTMSAVPAPFTFHRLFGDANGNRALNTLDFGLFRGAFDPSFDFDGNGVINTLDYEQFRNRVGKSFTY